MDQGNSNNVSAAVSGVVRRFRPGYNTQLLASAPCACAVDAGRNVFKAPHAPEAKREVSKVTAVLLTIQQHLKHPLHPMSVSSVASVLIIFYKYELNLDLTALFLILKLTQVTYDIYIFPKD